MQALPEIRWLDFPQDVVAIYESIFERTQGYFGFVAYPTDALTSGVILPGTMPPTKGPAQAVGYIFVLHPKRIDWCVDNGRMLSPVPDIQNGKPVRIEQVFVVELAYSKDAATRQVLLHAHGALQLAKERLRRTGYRTEMDL